MNISKKLILFIFLFSNSLEAFTIIAHRGASGYLPEHTLSSLSMAHSWNVDFIEPDVVMTKDGHLIVLHDIHVDTVTNVKKIFPKRHRQDGRYYAIDFTLKEIKKLKVHERVRHKTGKPYFPKRFPHKKKLFKVPTFVEFIETLQGLNKSTGKAIGLYVEFKAPLFHEKEGYDITRKLIQVLRKYNYEKNSSLIYIQCFDPKYLIRIHKEFKTKMPLIQLIAENSWGESDTDYEAMRTSKGLDRIKEYAVGIGPWIPHTVKISRSGVEPTPLVSLAHKKGLKVHAYTLRADQLPRPEFNFETTLSILIKKVGLDGIFTDFGDLALKYREKLK